MASYNKYLLLFGITILLLSNLNFINAGWYPIEKAPLAYWKFNSNGLDSSGNGLNLTVYNGTYVSGLLGNSALINNSRYFNITTTGTGLLFDKNDFSITYWFNTTNCNTETKCIHFEFFKDPEEDVGFAMFQWSTNNMSFMIRNGSGGDTIALTNSSVSLNISNSQWHFITIIKNDTNITLYIDNQFSGITGNKNYNYSIGTDNLPTFYIGRRVATTKEYSGLIDNFIVYNKSLNISDINSLWNNGKGIEVFKDFYENSQSFNTTTLEGNSENFKINITIAGFNSVIGKLVYNGTSYSGDVSFDGTNYILSRNINIPSLPSGSSSFNFYWNLTFTDVSGNLYYFNSNENTQSINPIIFGLCNSSLNISFINFTVKNAESPYNILNATFKSYWYFNSGSIINNITFEDLSEKNSSFAFCISPVDQTYTVSATIEYDNSYSSKNYYYLTNAVLTNSTSKISLYLLNDSRATLTELYTKDRGQQPISDIYIQIQAYDAGTNTYYTIANAKTNYNGKDIVYLNWYDTLYKFILTRNGQVVLATTPYKISSTPQTFNIYDTAATYTYDKFGNLSYSLTFNNLTKNFILTYIDPTGLISRNCLRVSKKEMTNETNICNQCESSSSATIYCNVAAYGNGTFVAVFYSLGSQYYNDALTVVLGATDVIFDKLGIVDGSFYALIFGGIVLSMFFISPAIAVFGLIIGIVGSLALGFQPFSTAAGIAAYLGIIILGGIVIWVLKR